MFEVCGIKWKLVNTGFLAIRYHCIKCFKSFQVCLRGPSQWEHGDWEGLTTAELLLSPWSASAPSGKAQADSVTSASSVPVAGTATPVNDPKDISHCPLLDNRLYILHIPDSTLNYSKTIFFSLQNVTVSCFNFRETGGKSMLHWQKSMKHWRKCHVSVLNRSTQNKYWTLLSFSSPVSDIQLLYVASLMNYTGHLVYVQSNYGKCNVQCANKTSNVQLKTSLCTVT